MIVIDIYGAHGNFLYQHVENIMVLRVIGSWNLECAQGYIAFAEDYYAKTKAMNLIMVIDITELEGMTPDAALTLNRYNDVCKERGMFRSQVYYAKSSKVMLNMALSLLKVTGAEQKAFKNLEAMQQYMSKDVSPEGVEEVFSFLNKDLKAYKL